MDSYYKLRQLFYYNVRHGLLQIATGITKCDEFITNCDSYYKVRWLLQIATVQRFYFFRLRLRVCHLGPAYDLMKTRLLESEAEAEG